jgi:uncharacterized membrane protein
MTETTSTETTSPAYSRSEDLTRVGIVYGLFLLGWVSWGFATFIGLIVAYASRANAGPRTESHLTFQIRTVWTIVAWAILGSLLVLIGLPLSFVLIGLPILKLGLLILALLGLLFVVRCVVGIIYLARGEDYPRPRSWFF